MASQQKVGDSRMASPQKVGDIRTKPPSTTKSSKATKLNKNILITDEKIIYQAKTHWFFYLDLGAVLLVILSSYFLAFAPAFIGEDMPTVLIWVPKLISRDLLEIAVWRLGLMALLFVGLMMLWEVFVIKQTTELGITSKRVLFKCGLLSRTIIYRDGRRKNYCT